MKQHYIINAAVAGQSWHPAFDSLEEAIAYFEENVRLDYQVDSRGNLTYRQEEIL